MHERFREREKQVQTRRDEPISDPDGTTSLDEAILLHSPPAAMSTLPKPNTQHKQCKLMLSASAVESSKVQAGNVTTCLSGLVSDNVSDAMILTPGSLYITKIVIRQGPPHQARELRGERFGLNVAMLTVAVNLCSQGSRLRDLQVICCPLSSQSEAL